MAVLEQAHLEPKILATMIQERLVAGKKKIAHPLDLGGAQAVARWIEREDRP